MAVEPLRILIVEDDYDHAQLEKEALLEYYPECAIETVDNKRDALARLRRASYSIIFLDYNLKGSSGLELLEEVQCLKLDVPVVIVTAMGQQQLVKLALQAGASDYLFKTSEFFNHLPRMVETNMERHRLRRERDRLYNEAREYARRTSIINRIVTTIRSTLDLDSLLRTLVETLGESLQVSRCIVLQYVSDPAHVPAIYQYCRPGFQPIAERAKNKLLQNNELLRQALETKEIVVSNDLAADIRVSALAKDNVNVKAAIYAPIIYGDTLQAVLILHQCETARQWTEGEIKLVQEICDQMSVAVSQIKLFEQVSHSKREWETTFDAMTDAVTVHSADRRIKRSNRAAAEMKSLPLTSMIGMTCCALSFPAPHSPADCICARAISSGESHVIELEDKASKRHLRVSVDPVLDQRGIAVGAVMVTRDITEQRKMQEQLLQSKKLRALGELASGVAHDFNNVLAIILGRAQLLQSRVTDETVKRGLDIIITSARDGGRTVKRIQDFARVRNDQDFTRVNIAQLIHEVLDITSPRWKDEAQLAGRPVQINLKLRNHVSVMGDPAELREVLINLIFNALDAMKRGGQLSISLDMIDGKAYIKVADTGEGMTEEIKERIFDPFFTTKGHTGMGLGLAISYSIIARHGGEIEVESRLGEGSCFTIALPAFVTEAVQQQTMQQKFSRPVRVLVVDDEPEVRQLLFDILESGGHRVKMADSGQMALSIFDSERFDLVLTDLGMPGMSGWEVAEAIKQRRSDVPVGIITGWGGFIEAEELKNRGIDIIINKPFDIAQILNAVAEIVERNRPRTKHA